MKASSRDGITDSEIKSALEQTLKDRGELKRVLLIPPDYTRLNSYAGVITGIYYDMLSEKCRVDIMPALGTHMPMSDDERIEMFGSRIPKECFINHNWRTDVVKIGEVPASFVEDVSDGLMNEPIDVEVNRILLDKSYDLIISIGQVVPHEVVGMANYSKNIFVGCGGRSMINQTHMLGAFYGLERIMGRDFSPVRKVFDYAEENFIRDIPLIYVLTVTSQHNGKTVVDGLFAGRERSLFEEAVRLSQEKNLNFVEEPLKKVVVYLDEKEFKSTWLGNKAVYRTRLAIEDGGELLVLAPGVRKFGEDDGNDLLIRKYGYVGREKILELFGKNRDLRDNQSVAAHLIHGSSDGRFTITYAVDKLTKEEVEGVNYNYAPISSVYKKYDPSKLREGFNVLDDGEKIYYIANPALGLWADRKRFQM
ncbi:D-mannonate epimerase [Clostridium thermosuccinogenes]|uniref:D-mannonate epimerase n=1 Tax=Clostridium thermosuccinogenes TaxID=84032 RepID=A0A2K2FMI3_9CLOT|nr:D-mannonate epimerase [Pseudoclostridium thermosuccinogenes]PNT99986.1 D-mannonate epimerase [Pseudoclostridium thermosuccinogenes]PNU01432.1 D-mannonate epimerase [Pseudoclostridium thermosuccinogenes]